ncbi:ABC transporter ATP-binding protein [Candidatus Peregrinibacteria bacterium CG10_big_fil_rev_8_21_14_0_10_49_16]|nr:MAG: ABC transporter ATP-binding protein [Candidatus Peregrinibacteria bacterium CG10_big_fil_rev_8_21_14_0_10_49_16]
MSREKPSETRLLHIVLFFLPYNWRYRGYYSLFLFSSVVGVVAGGIIVPLYLKEFIDTIATAPSVTPVLMSALYTLLLMVGVWSLVRVLCFAASDYCISNFGPKAIRDIENDCFKTIHELPLAFFVKTQVGSIVAKIKRFSQGYNLLDMHIATGLFRTAVQLVATVIVVAYFSLTLSLVFIGWGILYLLVILGAVRWKMRLDVAKVRADSAATGFLADGITNFLTVKMFARFQSEYAHFQKITQKVADATKRSWYGSTIINASQALMIACVSVSMLYLTLRLWQVGSITVGTIVLAQTYILIIGAQFLQAGEQLKAVYRAAADCMEMMDIIQLQPEVTDPAHPATPEMTQGTIAFKSVSFGHHEDQSVFQKFSLHIPGGQKVGIVGHSGAGKSTLVALLLRFMDVQEGAVTIDGQDIRSITQDALRSHISYVPQEPLLFHRSIRENIAYGIADATEEDIIHAAKQAHAHEFIEQMLCGYDTIVGERGIRLSGGERQRIAIARAMLKDAPILILDEATSSLDSVSEKYIQDAFDRLAVNRTTIVVAHRLSTLQKMNRIIVLDGGTIAEDGRHAQLLKKDGIYAELWHHQSDGFLGE